MKSFRKPVTGPLRVPNRFRSGLRTCCGLKLPAYILTADHSLNALEIPQRRIGISNFPSVRTKPSAL